MESRSTIAAARARPHSSHTHIKEDMFEQIKSEFKHNLSPLAAESCHENQTYETRLSRRLK